MREKKFHAAIPSLRTVTRERPDLVQGWVALAQCLQTTKQYSQAIEPYRKGPRAEAGPQAGLSSGQRGRRTPSSTTRPSTAYQTALELDPTYAEGPVTTCR